MEARGGARAWLWGGLCGVRAVECGTVQCLEFRNWELLSACSATLQQLQVEHLLAHLRSLWRAGRKDFPVSGYHARFMSYISVIILSSSGEIHGSITIQVDLAPVAVQATLRDVTRLRSLQNASNCLAKHLLTYPLRRGVAVEETSQPLHIQKVNPRASCKISSSSSSRYRSSNITYCTYIYIYITYTHINKPI